MKKIEDLYIVTDLRDDVEEIILVKDSHGRIVPLVAHNPEDIEMMLAIAHAYVEQNNVRVRIRKFSKGETMQYIVPRTPLLKE